MCTVRSPGLTPRLRIFEIKKVTIFWTLCSMADVQGRPSLYSALERRYVLFVNFQTRFFTIMSLVSLTFEACLFFLFTAIIASFSWFCLVVFLFWSSIRPVCAGPIPFYTHNEFLKEKVSPHLSSTTSHMFHGVYVVK